MNIVTVFKLHYFIQWGCISGILNYSVEFIIKYGEVSPNETGVLYCILPLTLIFAKPIFCSIADKYAIHEWILIISLFGVTIFYGLIAILPFISMKVLIWPLFCCFMLLGQIFSGVLTSIADALCMKIAESNNTDFGKIRVYGTIGWGLLSVFVGYINNLDSEILPKMLPGILFFIILEIFNCILMVFYLKGIKHEIRKSIKSNNMKNNMNNNLQFNDLKMKQDKVNLEEPIKKKDISKFVLLTCRYHPLLVKHIFICIVIGALTGLHWNYFPYFISKLKPEASSILIGYISFVQCFISELPFLYFAESIVKKIGSKVTFSLVLFSISIRYFLYAVFTMETAYYILFVELFHGIAFGLAYYNFNVIASEYSKKMFLIQCNYYNSEKNINKSNLTLQTNLSSKNSSTNEEQINTEVNDSTFATMQGIMSASFEGIGVAIGSLISGFGIHYLGFKLVWYLSSGISLIVFLIDLVFMLIMYLKFN